MVVKSKKGWIAIAFERYAVDSAFPPADLTDEKNCVEISYSFDIENDGWGLVTYDYIHTRDIKALHEGFSKILYGVIANFTYSAGRLYGSPEADSSYRFNLKRNDEKVEISLTILGGLSGFLSVAEAMCLLDFEKLVDELKAVAREFPVIVE